MSFFKALKAIIEKKTTADINSRTFIIYITLNKIIKNNIMGIILDSK